MSVQYAVSFGEYLRQIREGVYGESIREFAARLGLSPGYIGKLELGQIGVPRRPTLEAMAEKLNLDPDVLLTRAGYAPSQPVEGNQTEFMNMKLARIRPDVSEAVLLCFNACLDILVSRYPASDKAVGER